MTRVTWLGNNNMATLQDGPDGKPIAVGETINLSQGQIAVLERQGHRFAEPKEASKPDPSKNDPPKDTTK